MGFGVRVLGFRGFGHRVSSFRVLGSGFDSFRVGGESFRILGLRIPGVGIRVSVQVSGFRFRVHAFGFPFRKLGNVVSAI